MAGLLTAAASFLPARPSDRRPPFGGGSPGLRTLAVLHKCGCFLTCCNPSRRKCLFDYSVDLTITQLLHEPQRLSPGWLSFQPAVLWFCFCVRSQYPPANYHRRPIFSTCLVRTFEIPALVVRSQHFSVDRRDEGSCSSELDKILVLKKAASDAAIRGILAASFFKFFLRE